MDAGLWVQIGVGIIVMLIGFIVSGLKSNMEKGFDTTHKKLDSMVTKEMCIEKHDRNKEDHDLMKKDINNIANIARSD